MMRQECSNMYMRACICMSAYSVDFLSNEKSEIHDGKFIHHACNNRKIIFHKCEINFVELMNMRRVCTIASRSIYLFFFIIIKALSRIIS